MKARGALPALLVLASSAARADTVPAPALASAGKKEQYLAAKSGPDRAARTRWERQLERRIGKQPAPVVNVFNTWTHERLALDARASGLPAAVVNSFLRCHYTNQPTDMDPRLFPVLLQAAAHFGVDSIDIVSGFRAPKYNLMLRKKGHEVAPRSQHTFGHAVDFRLPGVPVGRLQAWAVGLHLGGVGIYESSGFVHVDVGPVRFWGGE